MPLFRQYEMGGVEVSVWKITETFEELLALVPKECYSACLGNFTSEKRCKEWLAVRVMVAGLFGVDARIVYDENGKPALVGSDVHISISHTDGYAAIACSCDEVGLDIELSSRNVLAVAKRFMQHELLDAVSAHDANHVALCHWCSKEALYKITGDLGGNFKDNISVTCSAVDDSGSFPVEVVGLGCDVSFVADYVFADGLLVVLCMPDVRPRP